MINLFELRPIDMPIKYIIQSKISALKTILFHRLYMEPSLTEYTRWISFIIVNSYFSFELLSFILLFDYIYFILSPNAPVFNDEYLEPYDITVNIDSKNRIGNWSFNYKGRKICNLNGSTNMLYVAYILSKILNSNSPRKKHIKFVNQFVDFSAQHHQDGEPAHV